VVLVLGMTSVGVAGEQAGAESPPARAVLTLVFSADGRMLASVSADGSVRLWDAAGREQGRTAPEGKAGGYILWGLAFTADEFATRQKAAEELEQLGELAEPELKKLLSDNPSPEARQQAERLLANLRFNGLSREGVLAVRAVAVLEHLTSSESQRLLEELARGAAGSVLTEEAKAALLRLAGRAAAP
jgi:hypothetical protein